MFAVWLWAMTGDHLDAILRMAGAKTDKEGWVLLPEGNTMTLHVAHEGASMAVARIDSLKVDGELVFARNPKRELFALVRSDVFAVALEGEATAGKAVRRAGFG
ncbi:MAG TPA: hypothetical protein VKU41_13430 [Polyangiaceae bacterium]|nr:hypothetical protein [Polyangiaceae bacterium]